MARASSLALNGAQHVSLGPTCLSTPAPNGCSEVGVARHNSPVSKWQRGSAGLGSDLEARVMCELWPEMQFHRDACVGTSRHCNLSAQCKKRKVQQFHCSVGPSHTFILSKGACHSMKQMLPCPVHQNEITGRMHKQQGRFLIKRATVCLQVISSVGVAQCLLFLEGEECPLPHSPSRKPGVFAFKKSS